MSEEPPSTKVQVTVLLHDPAWRPQLDRVEDIAYRAARAALSHWPRRDAGKVSVLPLGIEPASEACGLTELTVVLADNELVQGLNRDYRNRDETTNVLSFGGLEAATGDRPEAPHLLGDVVLARETVVREAGEHGKSVSDHVTHLVVHGVLHLLGYDHETPKQAVAMEDMERAILATLGVRDPYGEPAATSDAVS